MFREEIEVVMPNPKVVTPNLKVVTLNLKVVTPNLKLVMPNPKVEGMEEEIGGELSRPLEDLVTCENWHLHRQNKVYVFNMPLIL
jgi:hypothetical protein